MFISICIRDNLSPDALIDGPFLLQEKAADILERYNTYEGIDSLADAIADAKTAAASRPPTTNSRRSSLHKGKSRDLEENRVQMKKKDAWREDLDPETRVRAVTVPLLETEKLRLEKDLAEVSVVFPLLQRFLQKSAQVEKLAWEAVRRFREHRDKAIEAKVQTSRILDRVDHVCWISLINLFKGSLISFVQARKAYESLNDEEISEWTMSQLTGGNRD